MQHRKRLIPDVVLRHKDEDARVPIFDKYFQRFRKSKLICGAWFLILGAIGAHRIYLGQYKAAAIVAGLSILFVGLKPVLLSTINSPSDLIYSSIFFLPLSVVIVELILLPMNYGKANDHIQQTLVEDIRLTPYVPLS